jgi:hypothetical protein
MIVRRKILRFVLLTAAAALVAVAANSVRTALQKKRAALHDKRETADLTTQQIEDAIAALDPITRADVIARLTADAGQQIKDAGQQVKDRFGH